MYSIGKVVPTSSPNWFRNNGGNLPCQWLGKYFFIGCPNSVLQVCLLIFCQIQVEPQIPRECPERDRRKTQVVFVIEARSILGKAKNDSNNNNSNSSNSKDTWVQTGINSWPSPLEPRAKGLYAVRYIWCKLSKSTQDSLSFKMYVAIIKQHILLCS